MGDGLIHSFSGQLALLAVWAVLGVLGTVALSVLVMVRKAPPLTTQTDLQTGVKQHGIGRWIVGIAAVLVGPPVVLAVFAAGWHVAEWIWVEAAWLPPVAAAVVASGVVAMFAARRLRRPPVPVQPVPVSPQSPDPAPLGWSLAPEDRSGGL